MSTVVLSDGSRQLVLENVPEQRPRVPAGMNPVPDVTGALVIYERVGSLVEIPMSGSIIEFSADRFNETKERMEAESGQVLNLKPPKKK